MPIGRLAHRDLSESLKFAALPIDTRLLWYMLFPWMDALGRFHGSAKQVRGICCPYIEEWAEEEVERMLKELENTQRDADGLGWIVRYKAHSGQHCMWLPGFRDSQYFLQAHREAKGKYKEKTGVDKKSGELLYGYSNIPPPPEAVLKKWKPDKLLPGEMARVPAISQSLNDTLAKMAKLYEETFGGLMTSTQASRLKDLVDSHDIEGLKQVIGKAKAADAKNPMAYIESALRNKEGNDNAKTTEDGHDTSEGLKEL